MKSINKQKKLIFPCDFYKHKGLKNTCIKVVGWKRSCRYHKKIGQKIAFEDIVPKNFCIFAYHAIYPYALSLLYDGRSNKKVVVYCPASKNSILMEIIAYPRKLKSFYNLAEKCLRLIGYPHDIIDKIVKIRVVGIKGKCPRGITKGDEFEFNINNKSELCPASFSTLLPFILAKLVNPKDNTIIQCPADACKIRYNIKVKYEQKRKSKKDSSFFCSCP